MDTASNGSGPAIRAHALTKRFGRLTAVDELSLVVERGEVFALLGPNGAGKSTVIRILLDLVRATTGSAAVLGLDSHARSIEIHRRCGFLPAELALPPARRGDEYLDFLCDLRGVRRSVRSELVDRFGLDASQKIGEMSTGARQKIGIVQAFMHRPELVLLDEPTAGVDPLVQHTFHELVGERRDDGATIFLSSHTLSEVSRLADRVAVMRRGRMIAVESLEELRSRATAPIRVETDPPLDEEDRASLRADFDATVDGAWIVVEPGDDVDGFLRRVTQLGTIRQLQRPPADLEQIFVDFYRDSEDGGT